MAEGCNGENAARKEGLHEGVSQEEEESPSWAYCNSWVFEWEIALWTIEGVELEGIWEEKEGLRVGCSVMMMINHRKLKYWNYMNQK